MKRNGDADGGGVSRLKKLAADCLGTEGGGTPCGPDTEERKAFGDDWSGGFTHIAIPRKRFKPGDQGNSTVQQKVKLSKVR